MSSHQLNSAFTAAKYRERAPQRSRRRQLRPASFVTDVHAAGVRHEEGRG
jgi:hypothetical protein